MRTHGDWEGWLRFFLRGVLETSQQAVETARTVLMLFERDRERIRPVGRIAGTILALHEHLQRHPLSNIADGSKATGLNRTSISRAFVELERLGIVREITGQRRNRLYAYDQYLNLLAEGTEPLD